LSQNPLADPGLLGLSQGSMTALMAIFVLFPATPQGVLPLAALGGGLAIQLFGLSPSFAVLYLVLFLIVVAVGGLGSLKGTLVAALVIGVFDTGGKYLFPVAGNLFSYAITAMVLLIRPAGFYGRE
jgi:branched-subunit amino acid ABC-type transport system permease component